MTAQVVDPSTDPAWAAAMKLALGEWINWGQSSEESWTFLDDGERLAQIADQLPRARWLLQNGGLADPTPRAS